MTRETTLGLPRDLDLAVRLGSDVEAGLAALLRRAIEASG
jgi:hypothetical protein